MSGHDYYNMDAPDSDRSRQEAAGFGSGGIPASTQSYQIQSSMTEEQYSQERAEDFRQIAEDTSDMREMMSDLNGLIYDQERAVGDIHDQFENSTHDTLRAQEQLIQAAERDNARRRRKMCCYTCGGIAILIFVIYIYSHIFK
jgi:t-SNARE complex subunit (syntaxin)